MPLRMVRAVLGRAGLARAAAAADRRRLVGKRHSELRIVVPIVQHDSVRTDNRIMLSKCWSCIMCWYHCRYYLSAISSSCWWPGTPRWVDWLMWMLGSDFLRRAGVVRLLFVWAFSCWPTVGRRHAEEWSKLAGRGRVVGR